MKRFKAGFIGIVGQPNAGKSTLMNLLVQEKVAIVNPKPQTTRRRMIGITNIEDKAQIVFVDAPGLVRSKTGLNRFLEDELADVIKNSDVLLAVLSIDEKRFEQVQEIIKIVKAAGKPWVAVVSKTDLQDKSHRVLKIMDEIRQQAPGVEVFSCSEKTLKGSLRDELLEKLSDLLPENPGPLYDLELFTTHNVRDLAAEMIREKCFENLTHELPYSIGIRVKEFQDSNPSLIKIYAEILLEKESHKPIVIGKEAKVIKTIGTEARREIEKLVGTKVFLDLKCIVRENWTSNKRIMQELGYYHEEARRK
jgi:GTP-binding protein Era